MYRHLKFCYALTHPSTSIHQHTVHLTGYQLPPLTACLPSPYLQPASTNQSHFNKKVVIIKKTDIVYFTSQPFLTLQILHSAHTVYLCVLNGSQNKQPLFPHTALTEWFV